MEQLVRDDCVAFLGDAAHRKFFACEIGPLV